MHSQRHNKDLWLVGMHPEHQRFFNLVMREIKFRAWDKKRELFVPISKLCTTTDNATVSSILQTWSGKIVQKHNLELMQYTGLKDKNGKEIFEGDIIEYPYNIIGDKRDYIETGEVKWFKDRWAVCVEKIEHCYNLGDRPQTLKVLGNIHQNPELV